jgi:BirA family biotin operon repressor/biotin-[acetyl-CoA-carboxylase] ligase
MELLTEHTVAVAARAAGIDAPVHWLESTGSTNSDLWQMAVEGAPEWTLVLAGRQEAGRGRLGRSWVSAPGASLHVSLLLRPEVEPALAALITLAAGAALAEACRDSGGVGAGCKWPNDLVVGERKLGGVLSEASVGAGRTAFVVVGTGVNLTQQPPDFPPELRSSATSVAAEDGHPDGPAILADYVRNLRALYGAAGRALAGVALDRYRPLCVTLGRKVHASTTSGSEATGTAEAVDDDGSLLVRTVEGRLERVAFGEVLHLR